MKRAAFTMIELVFVIVVLGILTSMAMPRMDRDLKQEAADSILSAIRYTQHLALVDNKQMFNNARWQQRFWRIMFAQCSDGTYFYKIGSDNDMNSAGTFEQSESAIDPSNGKEMYAANNGSCTLSTVSPNILIGKKYGVTVNLGTGGCNGLRSIGFDHLGRPHTGFGASAQPDYASYMDDANGACQFNFTLADGNTFAITIQPETGYAQIVGQLGS